MSGSVSEILPMFAAKFSFFVPSLLHQEFHNDLILPEVDRCFFATR